MMSERKNMCPFVMTSLGCLAVSLLAFGILVYAIGNMQAPVRLRVEAIASNVGFWAAPVGIVIAIVGMVARRQRKWVCLIPLALNLLFFLATFSILGIGALWVGGN